MTARQTGSSKPYVSTESLRIGINLLYLVPGEVGGVETYAHCLLDALAEVDDTHEYFVFVTRCARNLKLPNRRRFHLVVAPIDARNRYARYVWEQFILPFQLALRRINLIHSLNYVGPLWTLCKSVVTIHDMNYLAIGKHMAFFRRFGAGFMSRLTAKTSNSVVTVSEFSKKEIQQHLGLTPSKIQKIHSGFGWRTEDPTASQKVEVLKKYSLSQGYIVTFGGGYPHKNIPRLLRAYQVACRDLDFELIIIGRLSADVQIESLVDRSLLKRVRLLGCVPTEDIQPILSCATLFVFPSLYEGFGFPILEAQRAHTSVICSNIASLPEIAGEAADYFDPESEADIARVMRRTLLNETRRNVLADLGIINVSRFMWKNAAREYLDLYRVLCGMPVSRSE